MGYGVGYLVLRGANIAYPPWANSILKAASTHLVPYCGNLEDAKHQRELMPFLGKYISRAELKEEHGMTKLTQGKVPTHTTWWPFKDTDRISLFAIEEEL